MHSLCRKVLSSEKSSFPLSRDVRFEDISSLRLGCVPTLPSPAGKVRRPDRAQAKSGIGMTGTLAL